MFQLHGKYHDMALSVKHPCHLNMAACLIKLKRYEEAIGQCNIVRIVQLLLLHIIGVPFVTLFNFSITLIEPLFLSIDDMNY